MLSTTSRALSFCLLFSCLLLEGACAQADTTAEEGGAAGARVETGLQRVIVVFKTHFDIGYTDLARHVVDKYRTTMIDKALAVCDHTRKLPPDRRFVWTLSGWPMTQILWPGQTPERQRRVERAIRDGLLVWHALPATTHTESLGLEDLVRGLGFSSRLARRYGMELPRDAKMTDVPSHSWVLPTLLRHAGVTFLHLGCNDASGAPALPPLFWWEGPDGSRLLTMYTAAGYGTGIVPPQGWPHATWLALIHTGDNHGPPTPDEVEKVLEQARRDLPGVEVRLGRLSDFGDAIIAESPDLPVLRKDLPDTWIHGIQSMAVETKVARTLRPRIATLEALNTLLCWCDVEVSPAAETIAAAYTGSLLYGEHTWGAWSWTYRPRQYGKEWKVARAEGRFEHPEESWKEHGAYILEARDRTLPALDENLRALAAAVAVEGHRVVVFNPLPWKRDGLVSVRLPGRAPRSWKDAATDEPVLVAEGSGSLTFLARDLPPGGYRTYVPGDESDGEKPTQSAITDPTTIENEFFRVTVDPSQGVIRSILDKRTDRELVDSEAPYGFGQYLYERFDRNFHESFIKSFCKSFPGWEHEFGKAELPPASEVPYSARSPESFVGKIHRNAVSESITIGAIDDAAVPHDVVVRVTLPRGAPWVDLEWTVLDKEPEPWPEAGWLCLPFKVTDPSFRLGRLGAPIDPSSDTVQGCNNELFCIDTGVTLRGPEGHGVGLCPLDSPLVSLGRPGAFRFSPEFTPRKPVVLVNLFNNIWGTNFQQWMGGTWSSRVRLWALEPGGDEEGLVTPCWAARHPCEAVYIHGPSGSLPQSLGAVEVSRRGVLLTAFGSNPDGDGTLLRLWEQAGESGPCRVRVLLGAAGAIPPKVLRCDLRGRTVGAPISSRVIRREEAGGLEELEFEIEIPRFAPVSVLLEG